MPSKDSRNFIISKHILINLKVKQFRFTNIFLTMLNIELTSTHFFLIKLLAYLQLWPFGDASSGCINPFLHLILILRYRESFQTDTELGRIAIYL